MMKSWKNNTGIIVMIKMERIYIFFLNFIFRMLRMSTEYKNINADTMYDVLHDPEYRKVNVNTPYDILNDPKYRKVNVNTVYDILNHPEYRKVKINTMYDVLHDPENKKKHCVRRTALS